MADSDKYSLDVCLWRWFAWWVGENKGGREGNVVTEMRCRYNRRQDIAACLYVDIIRAVIVVIMRYFMFLFKCVV
jgi:hypothetical protein